MALITTRAQEENMTSGHISFADGLRGTFFAQGLVYQKNKRRREERSEVQNASVFDFGDENDKSKATQVRLSFSLSLSLSFSLSLRDRIQY